MPGRQFAIGIDVGASKTSLLAQSADNGDVIEVQGPAANPKRIGLKEAATVLTDLIGEAVHDYGPVESLSICAGVAGAGHREEQDALADRLLTGLERFTDALRVDVVHDAMIALETAFGSGSGIVVITGTGSVSVGRRGDGSLERVGGWGHLIGDPGSGYTIGRAGLQAVAEAFEGGTRTDLQGRLRTHFDVTDRASLIRTVYGDDFHIQDVAPLVSEAAAEQDSVAEAILDREVNRLADQVGWLVDRCPQIDHRLGILGGMIRNEQYARTLRETLRRRFPKWHIKVLDEDPVVGALHRAHRLRL